MDRSRAARAVLATGATAYVLSVAVASENPGPRAWGLHLPGFLPPPARFLVMALLFAGASLLIIDFFRERTPRVEGAPRRREPRGRATRRSSQTKPLRLPRWSGWLLLLPWAWILWEFRTRTFFLGDATVWLQGIGTGRPNPYSEPLAAATWEGYTYILRSLGTKVTAATVGTLSVLCGAAVAVILWGIASELTRRTGSRVIVFAVLATLGFAQLYFGYIESYPVASVVFLAYLWLGLRRSRGADHPLWLAAVFPIAIAFHLAAVYLAPSYLYLVFREKRPLLHRAVLAILPIVGTAAILTLLGFKPSQWLGSFRIAARAVRPGHDLAVFARPYSPLSLGHAWDLFNEVLLVLPVPALLLLAAAFGRPIDHGGSERAGPGRDPATIFLAAAALPGFILASALVLAVPPAQDWDLTSLLLIPLALLGVKLGCSIPKVPLRGMRGVALLSLGAGALLSFVLVNANVESGIHRFETIVGPGAKITAYGRAYGNELLATYDEARRDYARALFHADRALQAEPTNPRYWVKKGAELYSLGRYDEAIPVLEEGIRRGPNRDDAYYDLGNCFAYKRQWDTAAARYRQALSLAGPRPDYLHNFGVALYNTGEKDSARVVWTEVLRRWPDYTLSRRSMKRHFGDASGHGGVSGGAGESEGAGAGGDSAGISATRR